MKIYNLKSLIFKHKKKMNKIRKIKLVWVSFCLNNKKCKIVRNKKILIGTVLRRFKAKHNGQTTRYISRHLKEYGKSVSGLFIFNKLEL